MTKISIILSNGNEVTKGASTKDIQYLGWWVGLRKLDITYLNQSYRKKLDMGKKVKKWSKKLDTYPLWTAPK